MSQPPAKRQRHDLDIEGAGTKSNEYWFDDGNVILQAGTTLYRVHSSMFMRHCEFFKDVFSMPKPHERVDGCPVTVLTDKEDDIENMISIFYDSNKIHNFRCELSAAVVASMLRLGRKYTINHLESEALFRLHHDYPSTLKSWDLLFHQCSKALIATDNSNDMAAIINLAHEFQLYTVLPSAYTDYLRLNSLEDLGTDDNLSTISKVHCLIGYAKILNFVKDKKADTLCPPLFLPATSCTGECKVIRWKVIKEFDFWVGDGIRGIVDPWNDEPANLSNLCLQCRDEVKKFAEDLREDFWTRLPTFFGLPAWEELKDGE